MPAGIVEGVKLKVEITGDEETIQSLENIEDAETSVEESAKSMSARVIESSQEASRSIEGLSESSEESVRSMEALENASSDASKSMAGLENSASDGAKQMERLGAESSEASEQVERSMAEVRESSERTEQSLRDTATAADRASSGLRGAGSAASGTATNLGFELVQGAQDAKFGLAGLANQIPLITEQFTRLKRESGSTAGALSSIFAALKGPTGIIAAFTLLLTFKDEILSFFSDVGEEAKSTSERVKGLKQATDSLLEGFQKDLPSFEITSLEGARQLEEGLSQSIEARQQLLEDARAALQQKDISEGEGLVPDERPGADRFADLSDQALQRLINRNERQLAQEKALRSVLEDKIDQRQSAVRQEELLNAAKERGIELSEEQSGEAESQSETFQDLQQQYQNLVSQQERLRDNFPGIVDRSQQLQKRIEATREAMRTLSDLDIEIDQSEVRQLRRRLSRLIAQKQQLEAPPQAEEVETAEPTGAPSVEEQVQDVELAGSPQELGEEIKQTTEEGTEEGISAGARAGAQTLSAVMSTAISEITRDIENKWARAITNAAAQALASEAVKQLRGVLSGSGGGGGAGGSAAKAASTAASGASFGAGSGGGGAAAGGAAGASAAGPLLAIVAGAMLNRTLAELTGDPEGLFENVLATLLGPIGGLLGAFAEGGYTGAGPKAQPAGVVHRGEYVMPAPVVESLGLPAMQAIHETGAKAPTKADLKRIAGVPQFASGGFVQRVTQPARSVGNDRGGSGSSAELIREVRRLRDEVSRQTDRLESVERRVVVGRRESRDIVETGEAERSNKNPSG